MKGYNYMIFYFCLLILLFNTLIFNKNKKMFVIFSFGMLFVVAALRKYTVGIDLNLHYANSFVKFGSMTWDSVIEYAKSGKSYYDFGFIIFMRFLYSICEDVQFFIIVTSAIICGLIGRYIYIHSKNVFIETFLFFTAFSYFMYMNIIAQGIAVAIVLFSIDYLEKKSFLKFAVLILLANFFHSSAIICLLFIPLRMIKDSEKNINRFVILTIIIGLCMNMIVPFAIKYIFPQFAFYFVSKEIVPNSKLQFAHLMIYVLCFFAGLMFIKKKNNEEKCMTENNIERRYCISDSNFFFYMTILSILFRFLAINMYIFSRVGFYFYMFGYSLLAKSIEGISNISTKRFAYFSVFFLMTLFFFALFRFVKPSYGVVPYYFYWQ